MAKTVFENSIVKSKKVRAVQGIFHGALMPSMPSLGTASGSELFGDSGSFPVTSYLRTHNHDGHYGACMSGPGLSVECVQISR